MILSATCTEMAMGPKAALLYRGDLEQSLKRIRAAGFGGVEYHIQDPAAMDRGRFKDALERYGLELTSIGTGAAYSKERLCLASRDRDIQKKAIERVRAHIETARDYRHAVVILGRLRGSVFDCGGDRVLFEKRLREGLKACLETAERYGVVLGLEMMNRYESDSLNRIGEGIALVDELGSPCLGLHIDTFHMNIEEARIRESVLQAGRRIVHVHAADSDRWYPGHGHFDFPDFLGALKEAGYQEAVAVECMALPDGETAGQKSAAALREWLKEA